MQDKLGGAAILEWDREAARRDDPDQAFAAQFQEFKHARQMRFLHHCYP